MGVPFGPSIYSLGSRGGRNRLAGGFCGGLGWIKVRETSVGTLTGLRASFDARDGVVEKCRREECA